MWQEFPADENTFGLADQFMFGSQLLIAPKVSLEADNFDVTFVTNSEEYIDNR
jgi:alpha-glucosidase (family GH31 glycosyl hydrolase)